MWWEPTNDYERALAEDVRSIRNWLLESSFARELGCFGAGSVWSWYHEALVPAIVLPDFPRMLRYNHFWPHKKSWLYRLNTRNVEYGPLFPHTKLPLHMAVVKVPRPANATIPSTAMSIATQITTDRIMDAFVRIRDPIVCERTRKSGTAGVVAFWRSQPVLITAGHTFFGEGTHVLQHRSRKLFGWLRPRGEFPLGIVTHHKVPQSNSRPGWDVAAIRCHPEWPNSLEWPALTVPLVSKLYRQFQSPEKVRVHGAYSGLVTRAVVQGALTDLGEWRNCWMVAPSGLLGDGDSGAAVFVERDASLLGMYVAKSELPGTRLPFFHYVQDAFSLEKKVLSRWDITFNV
jgi:hypothetical protein